MKKQIAVLMAAATAVTTVAPAIANAEVKEHKNTSVATVVAKIKEALNTKYADPKQDGINKVNANKVAEYLNSRYAVIIESATEVKDGVVRLSDSLYKGLDSEKQNNKYVVTDAVKAAVEIEKLSVAGENVNVYIIDKGIKNNSSVYTTNVKHYADGKIDPSTQVSFDTQIENLEKLRVLQEGKPSFIKDIDELDYNKFEITLKSGEKITIQLGGEVLDFNKAYTKDGELLDLKAINDQSVYDKVVKFDKVLNEGGKEVTLDVPTGDIEKYTVNDLATKTLEIKDIYTAEDGFNELGASFINRFIDAKKSDRPVFNYGGVSYEIESKNALNDALNASIIEADGKDAYTLSFVVKAKDKNDNGRTVNLQIKISGKTQNDLAYVQRALKGNENVVAGKFTRLIGKNRYATAVEISKKTFADGKKADTVVITGGDAIMDGLSAVPFASAMNAPILLADKNGLNSETMDEIARVLDKTYDKTLYIVGGRSSVPASVEKQLKDKFGVAVVRLSGASRYDTSLEVAKKLRSEAKADYRLFVVGGEGAADAMSISPVAADKNGRTGTKGNVSPILVVPKDGINRNQRDFLSKYKLETSKGYVIGGESTIGTQALKDLRNLVKDNNVKRISGMNRYETNLNIVNEFYIHADTDKVSRDKIDVKGLAISSGDSKYLVDAQTAGPLAANVGAPILLTASTLNKDQAEALKTGVLSGVKTNVYQIGGVIPSAVMKEVVKVLGL